MSKEEDDCFVEEIESYKPICYYSMNNGCVKEENTIFDRPDKETKEHLKPLFMQAKFDGVGVNKVLVDKGVVINLMPNFILRRISKKDTYLRPHYMILSDYEGKTSKALGVIQVDSVMGTNVIPTLFVVI